MSKLKRTLAGLIALAISAVSIGATTADAYGIIDAPSSEFEYELSVRAVSDTVIELQIDVTNNPGFYELSLAISYSGCTYNTKMPLIDATTDFFSIPTNNSDLNLLFIPYAKEQNMDTDYTGEFTEFIHFNVANAYTTSCQFAVAIAAYSSYSEDISFDKSVEAVKKYSYEDAVVPTTGELSYKIGDMNNDGNIALSDITEINRILSLSDSHSNSLVSGYNNKPSRTMYVDELNSYLAYGSWLSFNWRAAFPNLICAEVADATKDNVINIDDSDFVTSYYSNIAAGLPFDSYDTEKKTKVIVTLA